MIDMQKSLRAATSARQRIYVVALPVRFLPNLAPDHSWDVAAVFLINGLAGLGLCLAANPWCIVYLKATFIDARRLICHFRRRK